MSDTEPRRDLLHGQVSRRQLLQAGALGSAAAFLAACSSTTTTPAPTSPPATAAPTPAATPAATAAPTPAATAAPTPAPTAPPASAQASSAAPSASTEPDFTGINLHIWSGGTAFPPIDAVAGQFETASHAKVAREIVPGAERAIKFAGLIATGDTAIDILYGWTQFVGQFGDRLYSDLDAMGIDKTPIVPAIVEALSFNNKLRLMPEHSEMEIYIYNKQYFQDAGLDPEKKDWTWDELYAAAPALTKGNRFPCAQAWGNGAYYWLCFYNSIPGAKLLSDDRTAVLFDNDDGLLAFQTVDKGFKSGFFDPAFYSSADDYATGKVFNGGGAASEINFSELWGQAVSKNVKDFGATIDPSVVGATVVPGIKPMTSGTINGFEGFGISQFSQHKDAAFALLQILGSKEFQLKMHTFNLPSMRTDVLTDPENLKVFPVGDVLARQGTFNLNRYGTPFDWTPPFNDAVTKMIKGDFTAAQAHASAVKGVQDIIIKYLSS